MLLYYIMNKNTPIVTVTCERDLALLDLQAQSIFNYLDESTPIYIIVNELDPTYWNEYFNQHIKHYYSKHNLTILYRKDFEGEWQYWLPSAVNPWAVGWETQQILKLAIAKKLSSIGYLILDSQNFLIKSWSPNYEMPAGKIPSRNGIYSMPESIWDDYAVSLDTDASTANKEYISACTPIFMHTELVQRLIDFKGGLANFSTWFKNASRIKSEFVLYFVWAIKNNVFTESHETVSNWGAPYLRDSKTFKEDFKAFLNEIGTVESHAWISANHRSWGDMTDQQYVRMKNKLKKFNLEPHFEKYRAEYVNIIF